MEEKMKRFEIKIKDTGSEVDRFRCNDFIDIEKRVKRLMKDKFF